MVEVIHRRGTYVTVRSLSAARSRLRLLSLPGRSRLLSRDRCERSLPSRNSRSLDRFRALEIRFNMKKRALKTTSYQQQQQNLTKLTDIHVHGSSHDVAEKVIYPLYGMVLFYPYLLYADLLLK